MHDTQKVIRSDETIWPNGALKFNISKNSICGFSLHVSRPKKAHMHKFTSQQRNKATIKYLFRVKMSYSNQNNRLVSLVSQYGEILFSCVFIMDFFFSWISLSHYRPLRWCAIAVIVCQIFNSIFIYLSFDSRCNWQNTIGNSSTWYGSLSLSLLSASTDFVQHLSFLPCCLSVF